MTAPTPDSSLRALTEADFERVIALARRIWLSHFIKIVSREQIEYIMNARLTTLNLRRYLHADDRWLDVLMASSWMTLLWRSVSGEAVTAG